MRARADLRQLSSHQGVANTIASRLAAERDHSVPSLRKLRRAVSGELYDLPGIDVLRIVEALVSPSASCPRWFAYEIAHHHRGAMSRLSAAWLDRLGVGLSAWSEVDPFACYLLGPAWREGRVSDAQIRAWARSKDRWRRRSALAGTVALNCTARGGKGDAGRTFALCDLLLDDRDEMVVKALSWALRELAKKEPSLVEQYVAANQGRLAALVLREVRNKLRSGLKNPRRAAPKL